MAILMVHMVKICNFSCAMKRQIQIIFIGCQDIAIMVKADMVRLQIHNWRVVMLYQMLMVDM